MTYTLVMRRNSEKDFVSVDVRFGYDENILYEGLGATVAKQDQAEADRIINEVQAKRQARRDQIVVIARKTLSKYGSVNESQIKFAPRDILLRQESKDRKYTMMIGTPDNPEITLGISAPKTQRLEDLFDCEDFDAQINELFKQR